MVAPEVSPPPPQRKTLERVVLAQRAPVVEMSESTADLHIVQGISTGPSTSWRWTGKRPTVKLNVFRTRAARFRIDFAIPDVTFKDTGPVTIRYFVNDREIGRERYDTPGERHWEAPVPADWLREGASNTFAAEIDKVWIAKGDGATLGFILSRIGLVY